MKRLKQEQFSLRTQGLESTRGGVVLNPDSVVKVHSYILKSLLLKVMMLKVIKYTKRIMSTNVYKDYSQLLHTSPHRNHTHEHIHVHF